MHRMAPSEGSSGSSGATRQPRRHRRLLRCREAHGRMRGRPVRRRWPAHRGRGRAGGPASALVTSHVAVVVARSVLQDSSAGRRDGVGGLEEPRTENPPRPRPAAGQRGRRGAAGSSCARSLASGSAARGASSPSRWPPCRHPCTAGRRAPTCPSPERGEAVAPSSPRRRSRSRRARARSWPGVVEAGRRRRGAGGRG